MMMGRPDGLAMLDISADGFWNSFFSIVVAFPALIVGWVSAANGMGGEHLGGRLSVLLRLGLVDMLTWIVPIALLAVAARPLGIAHRFVPYVVATNWASALLIWMMMPPALVSLFWPAAAQATAVVSLLIFVVTLVLAWRVTNVALAMGPMVASWVFAGMFGVSLALLLTLQPLFGLSAAP